MLTFNKFPAMALRTSLIIPHHSPAFLPSQLRFRRVCMSSAVHSSSTTRGNVKKAFTPLGGRPDEVMHSMPQEKREIFDSLQDWVEQNILVLLKDAEGSWQPTDFLPDSTSKCFQEQVKELTERAAEIPDDLFVALVGSMITEEALPSYQTFLNTLDAVRDETGCSPTPWATWICGWTSEENKHGDLLNKYLYLSGRVDIRQIEKTIQYLITFGTDVGTENNPYLGFIYTSFQERATFINHGNTDRLVKKHGDPILARICGTIAADEKRNEVAYTKMVAKLLEMDPDGTMQSLGHMMRKKITMPGHWMYDGKDRQLFEHYAAVSQRLGVYTAEDYANVVEHFVETWNVERVTGLTGEGRKAQEYVYGLVPRIRMLQERMQSARRASTSTAAGFSWIFGTEVVL